MRDKLKAFLTSKMITFIACGIFFACRIAQTEGFLGRGTMMLASKKVLDCPDFQDSKPKWEHRDIIREAVEQLLKDKLNVTKTWQSKTMGETLNELVPNFQASIEDLIDDAISIDSGKMGKDARYHFDNEEIESTNNLLRSRRERIRLASKDDNLEALRYSLAISLATIQDFYSTSNWVELGNSDINFDLGVNNESIGSVASPTTPTCSNCPQGQKCMDNILPSIRNRGILTSGYQGYSKPTGKCSYGGQGRGDGINKAVNSACFSPHQHLHESAAALAVKATLHYMQVMDAYLGNKDIFNTLVSSARPALVFVVQISKYSNEELNAVKKILKDTKDNYLEVIIVPFKYPDAGPVIRSDNAREALRALDKISLSDDFNNHEVVLTSLLLSLHAAPRYSQLFLVTRSRPIDSHLQMTVSALAMTKKITITPVIIDFEDISNGKLTIDTETIINEESERLGRIVSSTMLSQKETIDLMNELALATGGQVWHIKRKEIKNLPKLISGFLKPWVKILQQTNIEYMKSIHFFVDDFLDEIKIDITGEVDILALQPPLGKDIDLTSSTSIRAKYIKDIIKTEKLIQIILDPKYAERGQWHCLIKPRESSSLMISGSSVLDITTNFYVADTASYYPSLQRVNTNPPKGDTYLNIVIPEAVKRDIKELTSLSLMSAEDGSHQMWLDLPTATPKENFYVQLPNHVNSPYVIRLSGRDRKGLVFQRLSKNVYTPSSTLVTLPRGREIWGRRGEILKIPVYITNTEATSVKANVEARLANGRRVDFGNERRLEISGNSTKKLIMRLELQDDDDTTNTVIISVKNQQDESVAFITANIFTYTPTIRNIRNQNQMIASNNQTKILSRNKRADRKPEIEVLSRPSCLVDEKDNDCVMYDWEVTAEVTDIFGLTEVRTVPGGAEIDISDDRRSSTVKFESTCCTPKVTIYATNDLSKTASYVVDAGNPNNRGADLGGGEIAAISISCIFGFILIVLIIVYFWRRNKRKDHVTYRGRTAVPSS